MSPLFSVIIPTFNRAKLIGETLDSLHSQTFQDYELLVIDDGSSDGTLDVVRRLDNQARVFEQNHSGCAAARNFGARQAKGEYLAFLDSDDLLFPWSLEVFAKVIRNHNHPAFVGGKLVTFRDSQELTKVEQKPLSVLKDEDFYATARGTIFGLGVAHGVVRRDAYLQVGGCEEININCTDSDLLLKMGIAPGFVSIVEPSTLAYRHHTGSTTFNFDKGVAGVRLMLQKESQDKYPGGRDRQKERRSHILLRTRGITVQALKLNHPQAAWLIYKETFVWNLQHFRWRYLLAAPLWMGCLRIRNLLSGYRSKRQPFL